MPIYLDFENITFRIHLEVPVTILNMVGTPYPMYWFIKFGNNYGPDSLSGVLSEISTVPMSGLLDSKGLISGANNIYDSTSVSGLTNSINVSNEGGAYHFQLPMPVQGVFNFTFYVSSSDCTVLMSPISVYVDSTEILNRTGSRVIEVYKKYEGMVINVHESYNPKSNLNMIDPKNNIVKNSSNTYCGYSHQMGSYLELIPTSEASQYAGSYTFSDPISGLSLTINQSLYNKIASNVTKGNTPNKWFKIIPFGKRAIKPAPIDPTFLHTYGTPIKDEYVTYENFTDKFSYTKQPESRFNPASFLNPVYDVDPAINASIVDDLTNNESINIPVPGIQSVINEQLSDYMVTDPSVLELDTTQTDNNKDTTPTTDSTSGIIWIILIVVFLVVIIGIIILWIKHKRGKKDNGLYNVGYKQGDDINF